MKDQLRKPCNECPFRKNSLQGYLGPYGSPAEVHQMVHGEVKFACHQTMEGDEEDQQYCQGALNYMIGCAKSPRDPEIAKAMERARGLMTPQVRRETILGLGEFHEYHKNVVPFRPPTSGPVSIPDVQPDESPVDDDNSAEEIAQRMADYFEKLIADLTIPQCLAAMDSTLAVLEAREDALKDDLNRN